MVAAVFEAVSRAALRRRLTTVLVGVLVAAWLIEGLLLFIFPPMAGPNHTLCYLLASGAVVNAIVLTFVGVWMWRGARWATWFALLTLVADALVVMPPSSSLMEWTLLVLTVPTAALVGSLLAYPEPLPAT